jgi:hypothetical protein
MTSRLLTSFSRFADLPVEIQMMIWRHAIQATTGREIILRHTPFPHIPLPVPAVLPRTEITSNAPIPALLHTCHLSRLLSQERWKLSMTSYAGAEKKVYVDVRSDLIYFPDQTLLVLWHRGGEWAELMRFVGVSNLYMLSGWEDVQVGVTFESPVLTLSFSITPQIIVHFRRRV